MNCWLFHGTRCCRWCSTRVRPYILNKENLFCIFSVHRLCAALRSGSAAGEPTATAAVAATTSHFWLLQGTSHKQWRFTGESLVFLPAWLPVHRSAWLGKLNVWARAPPPPYSPTPPPPSPLLSPPASLPPDSDRLRVGERRGKKWDDKGEMINDKRATKGSCGSETYNVDKHGPLTWRWRRWPGAKVAECAARHLQCTKLLTPAHDLQLPFLMRGPCDQIDDSGALPPRGARPRPE